VPFPPEPYVETGTSPSTISQDHPSGGLIVASQDAPKESMSVKNRRPSRQPKRRLGSTAGTARIVVANVNHPGKSRAVDGAKYRAMRRAILKVLPSKAPGLALSDALAAVLGFLPATLFPGGAHAGWWFKTVQLDLEAKRVIARGRTSPLRVHRL
jgi:hypothetical protein